MSVLRTRVNRSVHYQRRGVYPRAGFELPDDIARLRRKGRRGRSGRKRRRVSRRCGRRNGRRRTCGSGGWSGRSRWRNGRRRGGGSGGWRRRVGRRCGRRNGRRRGGGSGGRRNGRRRMGRRCGRRNLHCSRAWEGGERRRGDWRFCVPRAGGRNNRRQQSERDCKGGRYSGKFAKGQILNFSVTRTAPGGNPAKYPPARRPLSPSPPARRPAARG